MLMAFFLKHFTRNKKLSEELQLRFLKRLKQFLSNGYSLQHALEAMMWDKALTGTATYFLENLKRGKSLVEVFHAAGFHPSVVSFLFFVQANSNMLEAISKCAVVTERRFHNMKKFKHILRYPLLLIFIFIFIFTFINHQVLPSIHSLMAGSSPSLSVITSLMDMFDFIQISMLILLFSIIIVSLNWKPFKKRMSMEKRLKLLPFIPIYSQYVRMHTSFQFATHFSSLLKAGLTMKEILTELSKHGEMSILSYYSTLLAEDLNQGIHFGSLLGDLPFIENELAAIFEKHATVDVLERDLSLYSELLLDEMERLIQRVITWIQPIVYIVLGVFIIIIYLSILWPMLEMIKSF